MWGGCGLFGTFLGGVLVTRYAANKEALQMRACALIFGIGALLYIMVFLAPNQYYAMTFMAAAVTILYTVSGPIFSMIQSLVNDHMRAVTLAIIFLLANLVGFGLGPFAAGLLSDFLVPMFGKESLRYSLAAFSPGFIWVGYYYWKASSTIEADIRFVDSQ